MTETEYMKLLDPIDKAEESTTPFLVQTEKDALVVGDPNDTEIKKIEFKIAFLIPDEKDPSGKVITKEYHDVFIKPRRAPVIVRQLSEILPFFRKINDNGEVEPLTEDDISMILTTEVPEHILDLMYELVGTTLGIDERLRDYMMVGSVFNACMLIFRIVAGIGE